MGCDQPNDARLDEPELAFAGPVDPNGFQAPPTISIEETGVISEPGPDYEMLVRCSAALSVLQNRLAAADVGAQQRAAFTQAASLVSRRLTSSANARGKTSNEVSGEVAEAASSAAERPEESMREALGCLQRLAAQG